MKRADAIKRHGHYYSFNTHTRTVYEVLGKPLLDEGENDTHPRTAADAEEELLLRLRDDTAARITAIETILGKPYNKILGFLGARGWHKKSERINENIARLQAEKDELHKAYQSDFAGTINHKPLPDDIKIPVELPVGTPITIVNSTYSESGIRVTAAHITEARLYTGSSSRGDWDYIYSYLATNEKGETLSFEYNNADTSEAEIKNNYYGVRYFLHPEAADDHILATAARLSAQFSAAALAARLRIIDRGPRPANPPQPQP